MHLSTRKVLDRAFSFTGFISIAFLTLALIVILLPILIKGSKAIVFKSTVEHRLLMFELFDHGNEEKIKEDIALAKKARKPILDAVEARKAEIKKLRGRNKRYAKEDLAIYIEQVKHLIGPFDGSHPVLPRQRYGADRWSKAKKKMHDILYKEVWEPRFDENGNTLANEKVYKKRSEDFKDTALYPTFAYIENNLEEIMRPKWIFHWQFFTDESKDAHFFGGIWPEIIGTFYLTLGAMIFAVPIGVLSAIYLTEYAGQNWGISLLRTCISTLAGVPSIVFGLFGLAFFINSIHVSENKSVLAGALTLSLLILPTVIRASEEALKSVPISYKEASMGLGASKWHTIIKIVLPAALPGILTGIVISMGRAAGETAPIIFTAAVSVGKPLTLLQTLNQPTPALSWNIYNLCTEHEAVEEIRHVQYGMVMTLIILVLLLNLGAIILRARISKKLKG